MTDTDKNKDRMAREMYDEMGYCSNHAGPLGWHHISNADKLRGACSRCGCAYSSTIPAEDRAVMLRELKARRAELGLNPDGRGIDKKNKSTL